MEGVDVFRFEVRSILEKMKRKKKNNRTIRYCNGDISLRLGFNKNTEIINEIVMGTYP